MLTFLGACLQGFSASVGQAFLPAALLPRGGSSTQDPARIGHPGIVSCAASAGPLPRCCAVTGTVVTGTVATKLSTGPPVAGFPTSHHVSRPVHHGGRFGMVPSGTRRAPAEGATADPVVPWHPR